MSKSIKIFIFTFLVFSFFSNVSLIQAEEGNSNGLNPNSNYDLKVENIGISPLSPAVNQEVIITVQGRNTGTVDLTSGQGLTNIYKNFPSFEQTSMTIPDVSSNNPIEPGDPFMFQFTGSFTTSGDKTLYFKIDNAGELLEMNENNNTISREMNVVSSDANYDLKLENISISSSYEPAINQTLYQSVIVNQVVIITVQGRNAGTVDLTSGQGLTNIYKNFPSFEQTSMTIPDVSSNNPIEPGDLFMFQFTGSFITSGHKTLYFKIDNANELLETNENNNTISKKITVINSGNFNSNYDLEPESIIRNNEGLVLNIKNNGSSTFKGDFVISMFDLDGKTYVDYYRFNGSLTPSTTEKLVISNRLGSSQLYPNLEIKVDYADIVTETNENNNIITYNYEEPSVSDWTRVETNSNIANAFENGNKPKFEMTFAGEFIYNAGQVLSKSDYRGYYYKDVSVSDDFKLSFKVNSDAKFTDSNMAYFCLSTQKEGAYVKENGKRDENSFCFYDHSGRSFFSSLYGAGQGGSGFPHLAIKYFNDGRDNYYDVFNEISEYNIYAYKGTKNVNYEVVMQREGEIISASIYDDQNKLVYHWKMKKSGDIEFNYLTLAMGNNDDGDGYGSSGPVGKIWDIKLDDSKIKEEPPVIPEPEDNLIYESLLPLFNKYVLTYNNGSNSSIINSIEGLKKYAQEVKNHAGIIKIGSIMESKKMGLEIKPVVNSAKSNIKFIKKTDFPTVYQIDENDKKIKEILNERAYKKVLDIPFNSEADWSIVKPVSEAEFNNYADYQKEKISENGVSVSEDIKKLYDQGQRLIKADDDDTVYFITKDLKKKPIMNPETFERLGFKWQDIKEVKGSYVDSLVEEEAPQNIDDLEDE